METTNMDAAMVAEAINEINKRYSKGYMIGFAGGVGLGVCILVGGAMISRRIKDHSKNK